MIKKLKRRFIILAMVSLSVLLAVIVAAMNIVNYQKVVSDADNKLEVLEENTDSLLGMPGGSVMPGGGDASGMGSPVGGPGGMFDDDDDHDNDDDADDIEDQNIENVRNLGGDRDEFFGRGGQGGPSMSRDEAEESRFFTVTVSENGSVQESNVSRISAVDSDEAAEYAEKALATGKDKGFIDDFRFAVSDDEGSKTVIFLDCGRVLESFADFLKYSILMSVLGLLLMFAVISYFAGRIVKPVAESYEKQKRFITDAGHEIKTPLAIIKANIDLMDMDIESSIEKGKKAGGMSAEAADSLRDSLGDINDQVDRLTGLTNDLVYLSRMEEGGNTLVMTEVPFSDIVSETASSFEPLAKEQGKSIETDIEPLVSVKGSTKELEKLLSIVLENAVKYSPAYAKEEGEDAEASVEGSAHEHAARPIKVTLKKEGRNAVVEVSNATETELTNESLSHVFERFYRTDSSRSSQTGGHGIGLSMASAIVSAHGGKISARTTTGRDFMITASLPLA